MSNLSHINSTSGVFQKKYCQKSGWKHKYAFEKNELFQKFREYKLHLRQILLESSNLQKMLNFSVRQLFRRRLHSTHINLFQRKYFIFLFQRQGCIHGEELAYLFGAPLVGGLVHFGKNFTKSEVVLSETTMIYWSNFIRTGWVWRTFTNGVGQLFQKKKYEQTLFSQILSVS